jgi:hypothetical protein
MAQSTCLYLFNAFSDLVRPVVFIMRFGSVAIMFSIALYRENTFVSVDFC